MKGSALGFSFLTLVIVIIAVLAHMGVYISLFLGDYTHLSLASVSSISIIAVSINMMIVYGLRRRRYWAIFIGAIEMIVLIFVAIFNLWLSQPTSIGTGFTYLLIPVALLLALRTDYQEFKSHEVSHV